MDHVEDMKIEKRALQVDGELCALDEAQKALDGLLADLTERLARVCREDEPTKDDDCEKELALVPLADTIRSRRYNTERYFGMVRRLLRTLEV